MDVKKQLILFTLPNLNGGGAERVIINIIKSLDRDKFDIKLLLIDKIGVYFEYVPEYVEIISLDVKRVRNALPKLVRAINDIKPDIIFSTLNRMNILVLLASYFIDKNIKLYVREPNLPSAQIKNNNLSWWYKLMIKVLYPRAYKIVAQTDEMNEEIHRYFGVKKEKIITLINPIDKETIDKNLQNAQNPFEDGYENFVAVGRLSHQKGYDLLIEAFANVVKVKDNYRLYILGEGEDRQKIEEFINKHNLEKNVFLEGFQSNPHKYIKHAKAFILSSRWEGLPNVVLESLYIGTPVVMTRVNEYCERLIVENGFGVVTKKEITGNDLLLTGDMKQPLYKFVNDDGVNEIFYK